MNWKHIRTCAACGALLVGVAFCQVCVADRHGDERFTQTAIGLQPRAEGSHEDRAAEGPVDQEPFARRILRAATTSGGALDWLPQDASSDVVVQAELLRQRAAVRSQGYETPLVRIVIGNDKEIV